MLLSVQTIFFRLHLPANIFFLCVCYYYYYYYYNHFYYYYYYIYLYTVKIHQVILCSKNANPNITALNCFP